MKSSISLIKTVITTNFIIAGCSVLFFAVSRSWDHSSLTEVQPSEGEQNYHREVKAQISEEQKQLKQQEEQLNQKEQEIADLNQQLAHYQQSNRVNYPQPVVISSRQDSLDSSSLETVAQTPVVSSPLKSSYIAALTSKRQQTSVNIGQTQVETVVTSPNNSTNPENSPSSPIEVSSQNHSNPQLLNSETNHHDRVRQGVNYANNVAAGLIVAKQIRPHSKEYKRYQTAIILLRQGESLEEVAQKSHIPLDDLHQIIAWGENHPGNADKYQPPILSAQVQLTDIVDESTRYANDITTGLLVADRLGQINHGTIQYKRVQTAIILLRGGKTLEQAADQSNVRLSTLEQLIKWGEDRPGSQPIDWNQQISRLDN